MPERLNSQPNSPKFDLEAIFCKYHSSLIKTAENELRRQGVENFQTIAPDIVQGVYLSWQRNHREIPQQPSELVQLLTRYVQRESLNYVERVHNIDSRHSINYKIRDSQLDSLRRALGLSIEPSQESLVLDRDLKELIESVKNLTVLQKKILVAHFLEGKTHKEITEDLGLKSMQAVENHQKRALEILRQNPKFKGLLLSK